MGNVKWIIAILALVAVLASIVVPNYLNAAARGPYMSCRSNLKNIATALEMYATDHDKRYPPSLAVLSPTWLNPLPTCPAAGTDTYSESYVHTESNYTLVCAGNHHWRQSGVPGPNWPQYNAQTGLLDHP